MIEKELILASSSPRRKELLSRFTTNFKIIKPDVDERINISAKPEHEVERLSSEKAIAVATSSPKNAVVVAADTIVLLERTIYNKPSSVSEARDILNRLKNKIHTVITAVTIIDNSTPKQETFSTSSHVKFRNYNDQIIDWYLSTGEYEDRSGAYAIQGFGSVLVDSVVGDYDNIVGLPIAKVVYALQNFGIDLINKK